MRKTWKRFETGLKKVADVQAKIILTILYVLFVIPVGLSTNAVDDVLKLRAKRRNDSYWLPREGDEPTLNHARRQG